MLGTLSELRSALTEAEAEVAGGASARVSPFPELRDCAHPLQRAGFTLTVADADEIADGCLETSLGVSVRPDP